MRVLCLSALLTFPLALHPQAAAASPPSALPHEGSATLIAVVKDWGSVAGYTGGWLGAAAPRVPVELLAVVTAAGNWIDPTLKCGEENSSGCQEFLDLYLDRPKDYTILTSPG